MENDKARFWVASNKRQGFFINSFLRAFELQPQTGIYSRAQWLVSSAPDCSGSQCDAGIPAAISQVLAIGNEPDKELWVTGLLPQLTRWQWSSTDQRYVRSQLLVANCGANQPLSWPDGCIELPPIYGGGFIGRIHGVSLSPDRSSAWLAGKDFILQLKRNSENRYETGQWFVRGNCPQGSSNDCQGIPGLFSVTDAPDLNLDPSRFHINAGNNRVWFALDTGRNDAQTLWELTWDADDNRYELNRQIAYGDCPEADDLCRSIFSNNGKSRQATRQGWYERDWQMGGGSLWTRTRDGYAALFSSSGLCETFANSSLPESYCQPVNGIAGEQLEPEPFYLVMSPDVPEVVSNEFYENQGLLVGADTDSVHLFPVNPFYKEKSGLQGVVDYRISRYPYTCEQAPLVSASCQYHTGTPRACGNATRCSFTLPSGCDWDPGYTGNPHNSIHCTCPGCCNIHDGHPDGQLASLFFTSGLILAVGRNDQINPALLFWAGYYLNGTLNDSFLVTGGDSQCGLFEDTLEARGIFASAKLGNHYFVALQREDNLHYVVEYVQNDLTGITRLPKQFRQVNFRAHDLVVTADYIFYVAKDVTLGDYVVRRVSRLSRKTDALIVPNNPSKANVINDKLNVLAKVDDDHLLYVGGGGTLRILASGVITQTRGLMLVCFENTDNATLSQSRPCSNFNDGYGVLVNTAYGSEAEVQAISANSNRILVAGRAPEEGDNSTLFMLSYEPDGSETDSNVFTPVELEVGGSINHMALRATEDHIDWIFQRGSTVEWRRYQPSGTVDTGFGCKKATLPAGASVNTLKFDQQGSSVYVVGKDNDNEAWLEPLNFNANCSE